MANKFFHIGTAVVLVGLLVLLTNPFMFWMPAQAQMVVLVAVAAAMCVWAGFVMYERAKDEREVVHNMHAGRAAYLSGIALLTLALIFQGVAHTIDPWVPLTLGVMVVSKLLARLYLGSYQ